MKDIYESGMVQDSTELEVAKTLYLSSTEEYIVNHDIRDKSSIWFRIFEAKKKYFNADIRGAVELIEDDFKNIKQYSIPVQIELSHIFYQAASKYKEQDYFAESYWELSKELKNEDFLVQYLSAVNCLHLADTIRRKGRINEAEGIVYIVKQWMLQKDLIEFPLLEALSLSIIMIIQSGEENSLFSETLDRQIKLAGNHPILKPNYLKVLSEITSYYPASLKDPDDPSLTALFYIEKIDSIGKDFSLFQIYNLTNQLYFLQYHGLDQECLDVLKSVNTKYVLDPCSLLYKNIRIFEGTTKATLFSDFSVLHEVLKSECSDETIQARAALSLANLYHENADSLLKYIILVEEKYYNSFSSHDQFHYSDVLYRMTELKLPEYFKLLSDDPKYTYEFVNSVINSKARNLRKSFDEVEQSRKFNNDNLRLFITQNENQNTVNYLNLYSSIILNDNYKILQFNEKDIAETGIETIKLAQKKLKKDELLIEYFLGTQSSWLYSMSNEKINIKKLDTKNLFLNIKKSLDQIKGEKDLVSVKEQLTVLSNQLLPLNQLEGKGKIYLIPDRSLQVFPMHALLYQTEYLASQFEIFYPSSIFSFIHKTLNANKPQSILYMSYTNDHTYRSLATKSIPELSFYEEELTAVQNFWPNSTFTNFSGSDMTIQNFEANIDNHDLVYLNSHGVSNDSIKQDNYVYFREKGYPVKWYPMTLQHDLSGKGFILSACESGLGNYKKGESILSISNTLIEKKADFVIESLWKINEARNIDFLKQKNDNSSKKYLNHPYYWAGTKTLY